MKEEHVVEIPMEESKENQEEEEEDEEEEELITNVKLYFSEYSYPGHSSEEQISLRFETESQPPLKVPASKRFATCWGYPGPWVGPFNAILSMSLEDLNLDCVESVAFSFGYSRQECDYGPIETIRKQELETLSKAGDGILRLKFHRQHVVLVGQTVVLDMEVRLSYQTPSRDPGFVTFHFLELSAFQTETQTDSSLHIRRPFIWSIDVGFEDRSVDSTTPKRSSRVIHYAISGDSTHVCTLTTQDKYLQLDLWAVMDTPSKHHTTSDPECRGRIQVPMLCAIDQKEIDEDIPLTVSVSWDASHISLSAGTNQYLKKSLHFYDYQQTLRPFSEKGIAPNFKEQQLEVPLATHCGHARFHVTATENRSIQDEIFVTCDGRSVEMYSFKERWLHLRSIAFGDNAPCDARRLIDSMRARFFVWTDLGGMLLVGDLETGRIVSSMRCSVDLHSSNICFSRDGALMVLHHGGIISSYWTKIGTRIGSLEHDRAQPVFINETQIMLPWENLDDNFGRGKLAGILDATNFSVLEVVSTPVPRFFHQQFTVGAGGENLYSAYGSKLDLVGLSNIIVEPFISRKLACGEQCYEGLTRFPATNDFSLPSGLKFKVAIRNTTNQSNGSSDRKSVVVSMSDGHREREDVLIINPIEHGPPKAKQGYSVFFVAETREMIVRSRFVVMVWSLPATIGGDPTLVLTWWLHQTPFQAEDKPGELYGQMTQCIEHRQVYLYLGMFASVNSTEYKDLALLQLSKEEAFTSANSDLFLEGLLALMAMFKDGDEALQQAVLQYVGRYVNTYPKPDDLSVNIMSKICCSVTQDNHVLYGKFVRALLESSYGRWVPRSDMCEKTNPVSILLKRSATLPRAITLAEVIIDCCISRAMDEKDLHLLSPVTGSLPELLKQQDQHSQLALSTVRRLALIPVKDRPFIIDHHLIAHPPELRWRFWERNARPLYKCREPVLQLDPSPKIQSPNQQNDNFSRDLFVASFDMLWRSPQEEPESRSFITRIRSGQTPQSWAWTLLHAVMLKCKLTTKKKVECHDFVLQSLENPAIAALIEYKWNTIGFTYWLVRFVWQCLYYLLVLVAVFAQVYTADQQQLLGVFIAIVVIAIIFLWLELIQFLESPRRYISSPYNLIDLAVFTLPLAGSICQIFNIVNQSEGESTTPLSFSVLLVFLHFLFELRVNRSVCHFVTIIIRIIGEIRVFFFVFLGGILAFTIAILHLLRACPSGDCADALSGVKFSQNFFGAISSTYFFMGGIWDPVSDNFGSDNWSFHIMMIIYFFFTTILLLNVLIALINAAFSAGDETWLLVWTENRLRYVESAESMTYHIPGFRETHNWFPKQIFYSATLQQQRDYKAMCARKNDEDSGGNSQSLFGRTCTSTAGSTNTSYSAVSTMKLVDAEKNNVDQLRQTQERQHLEQKEGMGELKEELLRSQAQLSALQGQMEALKGEMKDIILAALAKQ